MKALCGVKRETQQVTTSNQGSAAAANMKCEPKPRIRQQMEDASFVSENPIWQRIAGLSLVTNGSEGRHSRWLHGPAPVDRPMEKYSHLLLKEDGTTTGLQEIRERMVISTLVWTEQQESTYITLMVAGLHARRTAPMRLTGFSVKESFPDGLTDTRAEPLLAAHWPHLRSLMPLERHGKHEEQLTVELLIGQDAPTAMTPLEIRRGRDGDPFAIRTRLGWAINGPLKLTEQRTKSFSTFVEEAATVGLQDPFLEEMMR
ncbi:hypothetical protein O3P69_017253 [Scylla paramamosain]|uniref:Uncharacterized protein n=1 Tax=Scylla paramamosain TaxID=85552 RepID=A0AAW0TUZ1_SCYPA